MRALSWSRFSAVFIVALVVSWSDRARADLEVSASVQIHAKADFEPGLAAHGTWVEVGHYGRCWRPAHVAASWRPYCAGEWVWTDCGWYWASDEPWGWACYHYGSWVYEGDYGWVWVPGVEWAPAWVSWRVGGGYIGWAPFPPRGFFFAGHAAPDHFVFVGTKHFGGPVVSSRLIFKDKAILAKAPEVGGLKRESKTVSGTSHAVMVNHGPGIDMVKKETGKTFAAVPIHEAAHRTPTPAVAKASAAPPKAGRETGEQRQQQAKVNHNEENANANSSDRASHSSQRPMDSGSSRENRGGWGGGGSRGGGHGGGRH